MEFLNIVILILGLMASFMSGFLAYKFWRLNNKLSLGIAAMAAGGAVAGLCTVLFSLISVLGQYGDIPESLVAVLRVLIFGGISGADIYMFLKIRQIERGDA